MTTSIDDAFVGFVGNEQPLLGIKRDLRLALRTSPPSLPKTYLLIGPPSVGKSEVARRISCVMALPLIEIDGTSLKKRENLFELIDLSIIERDQAGQSELDTGDSPARAGTRNGERNGIPLYEYPPFLAFVDEIHTAAISVQRAMLTLLESKTRSTLLQYKKERRYAHVPHALFIFATTHPSGLDSAFRSRCTEIVLQRYTVEQVMQIIAHNVPNVPQHIAQAIARAARLTPRRAIDLAKDWRDEMNDKQDGDIGAAFQRAITARGILSDDGITANDLDYLGLLHREERPMGLKTILATLSHIGHEIIVKDIEPYLLQNHLIGHTEAGRELTYRGLETLKGHATA